MERKIRKRGGERTIDPFVQKRLGIFLLIAVGGLAFPLGQYIWTANIPDAWQWYFTALLGGAVLFGEEYVRHSFKVTPEEAKEVKPTVPPTQPTVPVQPPP